MLIMVVHKNYFLKEKIFVFYKTHYLLKKKIYNKPKFYAETKLLLIKLFFQKKLVSFEKYIFMQKMCVTNEIYIFFIIIFITIFIIFIICIIILQKSFWSKKYIH